MNRIERIFQDLRATGGKGLIAYISVGDPDVAATAELLPVMAAAGANIIELGIPFSDPVADGPVIQASMTRALERGIKLRQIWEMVAKVRPTLDAGLVAMVSYSIVHRCGPERFIKDAAAAGIDGFIFPDLPVEEAGPVCEQVAAAGLVLAMLVAPNTPMERARRIAQASRGFLYVLSRSGITGERAALPADLPERLRQLRQATDLPLAVGFGISNGQQVREVTAVADAAIVGSALVRRLHGEHGEAGDEDRAARVSRVRELVEELASGLPGRGARV